jgi:hypothetical protein
MRGQAVGGAGRTAVAITPPGMDARRNGPTDAGEAGP